MAMCPGYFQVPILCSESRESGLCEAHRQWFRLDPLEQKRQKRELAEEAKAERARANRRRRGPVDPEILEWARRLTFWQRPLPTSTRPGLHLRKSWVGKVREP